MMLIIFPPNGKKDIVVLVTAPEKVQESQKRAWKSMSHDVWKEMSGNQDNKIAGFSD